MEKSSFVDSELEEGEIEFDCSFDDIYTPLERPTCTIPPAPTKTIEESDDNEGPTSSDSDSSDGGLKHPKVKKRTNSTTKGGIRDKKNKLKIWCNVLQAETVSTTLTDCNLDDYQKKIRGLLPYSSRRFNYNNSNESSHEEQNLGCGKRNYNGYHISDKKSYKDNNVKEKRGCSKVIPPLSGTWESDEMLAKEMAEKLSEVKIELILRAIQISGKDQIIPIFEETRKVEEEGGMLIMNGSRRRTSGGVFFYLLKTAEDIPQVQLKQIFETDKQDAAAQKRKVARQIRRQQAARLREAMMNEANSKIS